MFWDLTMDHQVGGPREHERLVKIFADALRGPSGQGLHARQNVVEYPGSSEWQGSPMGHRTRRAKTDRDFFVPRSLRICQPGSRQGLKGLALVQVYA